MTLLEIARKEAAIRSAYYEETQRPGALPPGAKNIGNARIGEDTKRTAILALLQANGKMAGRELARLAGGEWHLTRHTISDLSRDGLIVRVGSGNKSGWRLANRKVA